MRDKETFEYAIIRFVPRVERQEFLNVGVIIFCKRKDFLEVKYKIDEERIQAFAKDADINQLESYLHTWQLISQGKQEGGPIAKFDMPYRFRWLTAARSTIIQSSRVHPGLTKDPRLVLEQLFEKYVEIDF